MLYIENNSHDPYFNQAFEEHVFTHYREEDILLLWRNRPAVVCGSDQNIFAEVDVPLAQKKGIALVRRFTGGGTVYHDLGNLNYTLITDHDPTKPLYRPLLEPMAAALRRCGVSASINRSSDLAIDGLKISGSAQRVAQKRLLHHGTLLYNCDLMALTSLANGQRTYFTSKGTASAPWPVTNITDYIPEPTMSIEEFQRRLLAAFQAQMRPEEIRSTRLSESELAEIRELAEKKYHSWEWTFGKSPAFTYSRTFHLRGKEQTVRYSAENAVIREISCSPEQSQLKEALLNRRLDTRELTAVLRDVSNGDELLPYLL